MWEKALKSDISKIYGGAMSTTNKTTSSFTFEDLKNSPIIDYIAPPKPEYKEIGTIPKNTHIYKRIIKFWIAITHTYDASYEKPSEFHLIDKIVIVEGGDTPKEAWDSSLWAKELHITQEWLKNFINKEELAELTAIRMLGNAK